MWHRSLRRLASGALTLTLALGLLGRPPLLGPGGPGGPPAITTLSDPGGGSGGGGG